jgi:hypothetical protein
MEIKLDGKDPKKEENGEDHPGTHSGSFHGEQEGPQTEQYEKENPSLRKERKVKMAGIDSKGVNDEDGNQRKTKGAAHVGLSARGLVFQ